MVREELKNNVISMYARGMSTQNISGYVKEIYAIEVSATEIPNIMDKVIPALNEWRNRHLESLYLFVFLDCMHYNCQYPNACGVQHTWREQRWPQGPAWYLSIRKRRFQVLAVCIDGSETARRRGYPGHLR